MDPTLLAAPNTPKGKPKPVDSKAILAIEPGMVQAESTPESETQEDWLCVATTDPASWLKGINH